MTWVIGACPMLGSYAIAVSDIQLTLGDGRTFDLVRKVYPVGPNILGGFAGSVYIGFELLQSIASFLQLPPGADPALVGWHPDWVAENWAPIARSVFESAPANQKQLGAQFLIVGPDPTEDTGIPGRAMPYLCRFTAPAFEPEITRGGNSAISIGSGANVPAYVEGIKELMNPYADDRGGLLQAEVNNIGGWANAINIAVSFLLERHPVAGISQHIHTHVASREGFRMMTSDRVANVGTPEEKVIEMPKVAQNMQELIDLANCLGINAAIAVA